MKKSEITQLKRDLLIGITEGILKEIIKEDNYDFAVSRAYSYMCEEYPRYNAGKIADLIAEVFNNLFDTSTIKMVIRDVINDEIEVGTLDELFEEDYFPYEG